jgi:hypothetical protein
MNENDFFVDKDKVENITEVILYNKDGEVVSEEEEKFIFMKEIRTDKSVKYFLMFNKSELVNPLGDNTFLRNYNGLTQKKVGPKAARFYLRYLREKNSRYFIMCRRDIDA